MRNSRSLLGDQCLTHVYRLVSQRFYLEAWNASILRKLQTLESIYGKMSNRAGTRRMEVLEWIIIMLITLSIAVSLFPAGQHSKDMRGSLAALASVPNRCTETKSIPHS
ncbi:MAG: hypothetical protein AAB308_16005 [Nitrospirota bacterium]